MSLAILSGLTGNCRNLASIFCSACSSQVLRSFPWFHRFVRVRFNSSSSEIFFSANEIASEINGPVCWSRKSISSCYKGKN